jgi:RNA polymerase sigma-70 factor (ECF subfamily)
MERDLNDMSDEEMLTYCRYADQETMRTCVSILARRYESSLLNYIYRMVADREIAEDLLQETFVRIYRKSREYRRIARFSTWLFKIATNLSLNEIRNRRHRPGLTLDLPVEAGEPDAEALITLLESRDAQVPVRLLEDKELGRVVEKILGELPEPYRVVIILCDIEKFSYREAADVLNVRPGTVGSRLARAREYFAGKLVPYMRQVRK